MEIEILSESENKLLDRKDIKFKITFDKSTPKLSDVRNLLVPKLNLNPDLTVIDKINQEYGITNAVGYAKIYNNEDALKVELRHILNKNFGVEKANKLLGEKKKKEKGKKNEGAKSNVKK